MTGNSLRARDDCLDAVCQVDQLCTVCIDCNGGTHTVARLEQPYHPREVEGKVLDDGAKAGDTVRKHLNTEVSSSLAVTGLN